MRELVKINRADIRGGVEASFKAYNLGYRFINFGNLLWDGANGLKANLKQLRELASNA